MKKDFAFRRVVAPLAAKVVLGSVAAMCGVGEEAITERKRDSSLRILAAQCLVRYSGQTQREAARTLGMATGAAVSAQLKRMPALLKSDRALAKLLRRIELHLEELRDQAAGQAG